MKMLRLLAAAALLCAPLTAHAQTARGTSRLSSNQCVVDIVATGPNGEGTTMVPCSTPSDPAGAGATMGATANAVKYSGQACTASAVALPDKAYLNGFVVKARATNAGSINVGGLTTEAPTASTGYPLAAGEAVSFGASNTKYVSIICATGGSGGVDVTGN